MKKFWKTFAGQLIHQSPSGVEVYQNMFFRWLTFNSDALQTLIHRHHLAVPGLLYINHLTFAVRVEPADCCLLGLGGAGVAHALAPFLGGSTLTAVEINPEIIDIAERYFMTNRLKNMTVIHQDAYLFVQQTQVQYQHVIVDLFNADSFPDHCKTIDFFAYCRSMLLPGGIFAINLTNIKEQRVLFDHIREQFKRCTVSIPIKRTSNMVVLAYNGESVSPLLALLERGPGRLKKLVWDAEWGCIAEKV